MKINASSPEAYIAQLPDDRQIAINSLREAILKNIPAGFIETINYGMIGYVVPLATYPNGYLNNPKEPLPFINIASQKNYIAVYHMGLYVSTQLLEWFTNEYPKHCKTKLDMGKSCIRFKKADQIPYSLMGELAAKITPAQWIELYETIK